MTLLNARGSVFYIFGCTGDGLDTFGETYIFVVDLLQSRPCGSQFQAETGFSAMVHAGEVVTAVAASSPEGAPEARHVDMLST